MSSQPNYPLSTSTWYAENYYNAGFIAVANLCSECGKPCDEPTCKLCLEGIAEMLEIMDQPVNKGINYAAVVVGFVLTVLVAGCWL